MSNSDLELILTRYNNWDTEAEKEQYIDKLENIISSFNSSANQGEPIVPDAIYDTCVDYLKEIKPDSPLLHQVWSEDDPTVPFEHDLDTFLVRYPMLSIQTVKHIADRPVTEFQDKLPAGEVEVCCSVKENGHGARVIWQDGHLVKATSRGRSTNGKDLKPQMQILLGDYFEEFVSLGVVEMRCEVMLPFSRLEEARKHNPNIKSAFTGVSSMIKESATTEETQTLEVVFYDILCDNLEFETLSQKLEYIEDCGFTAPIYFTEVVGRKSLEEDIKAIVNQMDIQCTDYDLFTDGVVISINDISLFEEFGAEDKFRLGNLAIKMGRWKQDSYNGVIKRISWTNGKSKKTPVAILETGVLTASGTTVTNIPLYAPCYILMLEAYPGNTVHFRYGGEAGVVPVTQDGRLVTDTSLKN